ncbi:MAG: PEP-CTERM sorting domain-containing protein, partial [Deltaproteobacteria bacterium]|nr:PEP-CTERM sorting domain-containing protein [Deltaproteobacteria bacterium]
FEKGLTAADVLSMSAPNSSWADPMLGNISNAGCTDGSNAGLICTNGLLAIPDEDAALQVFSWDFDVSGALLKTDEWSIRGAFGRANGWVISESGTPIPEPTSALLFAVGFGVAGGAVRRRKT